VCAARDTLSISISTSPYSIFTLIIPTFFVILFRSYHEYCLSQTCIVSNKLTFANRYRNRFNMGDLYRSEPMQLIQLFIPQEVVQTVVEALGERELIEFVDVRAFDSIRSFSNWLSIVFVVYDHSTLLIDSNMHVLLCFFCFMQRLQRCSHLIVQRRLLLNSLLSTQRYCFVYHSSLYCLFAANITNCHYCTSYYS
jgi:hypothetical protein